MAQFTVNPQRFDPYKNFKFRVQVGRPLRRRGQQGQRPEAHDRGGQAPRGRRPQHQPQVAGPHRVRGHHARARGDPRHGVRAVGQQGLELRRRPRHRGLAEGLPQGHHHRGVQRGRASWRSPTRSIGCWVSEFQALPDLDANANAVAIEHIKLENEGWERDLDVTEPTEPIPPLPPGNRPCGPYPPRNCWTYGSGAGPAPGRPGAASCSPPAGRAAAGAGRYGHRPPRCAAAGRVRNRLFGPALDAFTECPRAANASNSASPGPRPRSSGRRRPARRRPTLRFGEWTDAPPAPRQPGSRRRRPCPDAATARGCCWNVA